mmetsp:Transcript_13571/g.31267  ORF Transcript_13571/g.31267 Transcript_13571/m.31267 type:complete len:222 (+) Transcript_13571:418-1083(+)
MQPTRQRQGPRDLGADRHGSGKRLVATAAEGQVAGRGGGPRYSRRDVKVSEDGVHLLGAPLNVPCLVLILHLRKLGEFLESRLQGHGREVDSGHIDCVTLDTFPRTAGGPPGPYALSEPRTQILADGTADSERSSRSVTVASEHNGVLVSLQLQVVDKSDCVSQRRSREALCHVGREAPLRAHKHRVVRRDPQVAEPNHLADLAVLGELLHPHGSHRAVLT